jgi:hypothetical protein
MTVSAYIFRSVAFGLLFGASMYVSRGIALKRFGLNAKDGLVIWYCVVTIGLFVGLRFVDNFVASVIGGGGMIVAFWLSKFFQSWRQ